MLRKKARRFILWIAVMALFLRVDNVACAEMEQRGVGSKGWHQSENTHGQSILFSVSEDGNYTVQASVTGKAGTSKISMTVKVQKYNDTTNSWELVKKWDKTGKGAYLSLDESGTLTKKGIYRCKVIAYVDRKGEKEKISCVSAKKNYWRNAAVLSRKIRVLRRRLY